MKLLHHILKLKLLISIFPEKFEKFILLNGFQDGCSQRKRPFFFNVLGQYFYLYFLSRCTDFGFDESRNRAVKFPTTFKIKVFLHLLLFSHNGNAKELNLPLYFFRLFLQQWLKVLTNFKSNGNFMTRNEIFYNL